jgi:hypothetical protein
MEMAIACKVCDREFGDDQKPQLMAHMRSEHEKCGVCGHWVKTKAALGAHMRKHRKEIKSEQPEPETKKPKSKGRRRMGDAKKATRSKRRIPSQSGVQKAEFNFCPHCGERMPTGVTYKQ